MNRTEFFQHVELAEMYAKDGAWATAAEKLRKAAEMADEEVARRAELLHPDQSR